jgi:hypothetical protein
MGRAGLHRISCLLGSPCVQGAESGAHGHPGDEYAQLKQQSLLDDKHAQLNQQSLLHDKQEAIEWFFVWVSVGNDASAPLSNGRD